MNDAERQSACEGEKQTKCKVAVASARAALDSQLCAIACNVKENLADGLYYADYETRTVTSREKRPRTRERSRWGP